MTGDKPEKDGRFPLGVTAVMLPELDFSGQLALCKDLDLKYYIYRPRVIPVERRAEPYSNWGNHQFDLTPDRLISEGALLAGQLEAQGVVPYCTLPEADTSTSDEVWEVHIRGAVAGRCSRVRISPVDHPTQLFDYAKHVEEVIARYRSLIPRAKQAGLKVVIEMHVGNAACGPGLVYNVVRNFDPEDLGVIVDFPNLAQQGYVDPVLAVSVLAPWIDHCHLGAARRIPVGKDEFGCLQTEHEFCALNEGDLHIPAWINALASFDRTVPLVIEDFSNNMTGADRLRRSARQARELLAMCT
jgi:sugar phosphate isomerase/epimerase